MTDPTVEKADRLLDVGRPAEAVALLEAAGVPDVGSPAACATLAGARFEAGDWYGALYAADRALALLPDQEFPLRIRALALAKLGHHREALAAIRRAVRLHPGEWRTHLAHAHVLYGAEDFRAARGAVEPAIELVPQEPGPHSIAGSIALRLGDLARARQHFETSLRLDPNQTRVINALGAVAMKEGDLEAAREHFVDAARTAPNPSAVRNVELVEDQQFRQAHPHRVRWRARIQRLRGRPKPIRRRDRS